MGRTLLRRGFASVAALMAILGGVVGLGTPPALAATASATDIVDPDLYRCAESGFISFETMTDGTDLEPAAINGVRFSTTGGFTWIVGDFATGGYNGKYPAGGYTSQGTHWAWLGPSQGAGRIDFVNGPTSYISLLVSDNQTPVALDAYRADGTLVESAGPAELNYNTGHMTELKIVRPTADISYVIVHDNGNFFLIDALCTDAPGVPRNPLQDFKQNANSAGPTFWANDPMYDVSGCRTMAQVGCALTAFTDVITSYGVPSLPGGTAVDPGSVNHYLAKTNGHVGCDILWVNAAKVFNLNLLRDDRAGTTSLADRVRHIDEALAAGNLVIMGFDPPGKSTSHFIVLYEKTKDSVNGSPDYLIADPYRYAAGDRTGKRFSEAYGTTINALAGSLHVVVIENKAAKPGRSWAIVAHSPVELLVTDPGGAQTGFLPASAEFVNAIDGSSYGRQAAPDDDDAPGSAAEELLYFGQTQVAAGTYRVDVIGTGTGPYRLDVAVTGGPDENATRGVDGTAAPGRTDTYLVSVSPDGAIDIQLVGGAGTRPGENNLLPVTGSGLTSFVALAAAMVIVGLLLVLLARRRRS